MVSKDDRLVDCPECYGLGFYVDDDDLDEEIPCEQCDGVGQVPVGETTNAK